MLNKETITQENSIEEYFCKPFDTLKRVRISDDIGKMFINIMLSPDELDPDKKKKMETDFFLYQVGVKRIEHVFNYKLDWKTLFFIAYLSENPAILVMYLTYIQYWSKKNNKKDITFNMFGMDIFPSGFPSKEDLLNLWDNQKVDDRSDNLLDHFNCLKSIL